jgi:long-subunit fatty acid transport protein
MARYNLNDNLSFIGGVTQNAVGGGNVTTLGGTYDVCSTSSVGYFGGIAYSVPEIALRAELVYQPKAEFTTCTSSAPTAFGVAGTRLRITGLVNAGVTALQNPLVALNGASDAILQAALTEENEKTTLALPETVAFNFQTGIAADTLLTASYRKASWCGAQINIAAPIAIETEFSAYEAYSIGLGRRFTDNLSASLTYSKEEGSIAPATSLFTVSNGSKALSLGIQYKRDNMTISGGISQRNVGDVTVNAAGVGTMKYTGNSVTAMGEKIAFAF